MLVILKDVFEAHLAPILDLQTLCRVRRTCTAFRCVGNSVLTRKRNDRLMELIETLSGIKQSKLEQMRIMFVKGCIYSDESVETDRGTLWDALFVDGFFDANVGKTFQNYAPFHELAEALNGHMDWEQIQIRRCDLCEDRHENVFLLPFGCCWACALQYRPFLVVKKLFELRSVHTSHFKFVFKLICHPHDDGFHVLSLTDFHSSNGGLEAGVRAQQMV